MRELITARARLRVPRYDDAPDLFKNYAGDAQVTRYLSWEPHASIIATSQWIALTLDQIRDGRKECWVIDGAQPAIGMIELRPAEPDCAEVGYVLAPAFWGRGIMTEALCAVLAHGTGDHGLKLVRAYCDVENVASARVMQKAGMRFARRVDDHLCHPAQGEGLRDTFCYEYP